MKEKLCWRIAKLVPRCIAYWVFIRVAVHATQGKYSNQIVPELTAMDALKRWTA